MKNAVRLLCVVSLVCVCNAVPAIYLSAIKNDTPDTLYKIIIPAEDYEILLPAGTQKYLGEWFDLQRGNEIQLAVIKGDGEPIFIQKGPESAGCEKDAMAHSVIFWTGLPMLDTSQRMYQTYCQIDRDLKLELSIDPEGNPIVNEIKS